MGFFSYECKGCGRSLLSEMAVPAGSDFGWMTRVVVVAKDGDIVRGDYDGYGRVETESFEEIELLDLMWDEDGPACYHEACHEACGKPAWDGTSPHARDQGWFFEDDAYQGTVPGVKREPSKHSVLDGLGSPIPAL